MQGARPELVKTYTIDFKLRWSALVLELNRTVLSLSSSPLTFKLRMISSIVVLAPHGEVAKAFSVARLATYKFLVSLDAVVGLELLATDVADKN